MNDDRFEMLAVTANEIGKAWAKHDRLLGQRRVVTQQLVEFNAQFDAAVDSNGKLDCTAPQRKILEASALLDDCEKRIVKARAELIEACACIHAEGFFEGMK